MDSFFVKPVAIVYDDEPFWRTKIRGLLGSNFRVVSSTSLCDFYRNLRVDKNIGLIVLDTKLEESKFGPDVIAQIRKLRMFDETCICSVSSGDYREICISNGADYFINKFSIFYDSLEIRDKFVKIYAEYIQGRKIINSR